MTLSPGGYISMAIIHVRDCSKRPFFTVGLFNTHVRGDLVAHGIYENNLLTFKNEKHVCTQSLTMVLEGLKFNYYYVNILSRLMWITTMRWTSPRSPW